MGAIASILLDRGNCQRSRSTTSADGTTKKFFGWNQSSICPRTSRSRSRLRLSTCACHTWQTWPDVCQFGRSSGVGRSDPARVHSEGPAPSGPSEQGGVRRDLGQDRPAAAFCRVALRAHRFAPWQPLRANTSTPIYMACAALAARAAHDGVTESDVMRSARSTACSFTAPRNGSPSAPASHRAGRRRTAPPCSERPWPQGGSSPSRRHRA